MEFIGVHEVSHTDHMICQGLVILIMFQIEMHIYFKVTSNKEVRLHINFYS